MSNTVVLINNLCSHVLNRPFLTHLQFLTTSSSVQHQQHQRQQAALAAAAASVGLPAGLLPGMLSGLTTPSGLKEEHNQNGTSVAVSSSLNRQLR